MGTSSTTPLTIGLHELDRVRWPGPPLTGDGKKVTVRVPIPRLPWSRAAIEVPLGESVTQGLDRVTLLRKIFGYGVAPAIIILFVVADVLLVGGTYGDLDPNGPVFAVIGIVGVALLLTGFVPDLVARATGTPYVSRGTLRLSQARVEVVAQLAKLNPQLGIEAPVA